MNATAAVFVLVLVAGGCTSSGRGTTAEPSPPVTVGESPARTDGPSDLPAVDPPPLTLQDFADAARRACRQSAAILAEAPLRGDPFVRAANRADVAAAEVHYRAAARAWTAMAETLWQFGLPESGRAQRLITQLDTAAQYSNQAAELFAERDLEPAQNSVKWAAQALRRANRVARSMGVGPLEHCGQPAVTLSGTRRVVVRATDFAFSTPRLRRGPTRLVLRNRGREPHQLFVVPLRRAGTLQQAIAADRGGRSPARFLARPGDTTRVVPPGARASVDVRLRRGPYGLLCFVASPDDTPHAYKGMAAEVRVR